MTHILDVLLRNDKDANAVLESEKTKNYDDRKYC